VTSDPGLQFQAVDAFVDLVDTLGLGGPLVLSVDDLQWTDPSSLLTLAAVGRRLTHAPVALLVSLQPEPRAETLGRVLGVLDIAGPRRLPLGRLEETAVHDLVVDVIASEPTQTLMAQLSAAAGNPLFVTELLAAILEEGAIRTIGERTEMEELTLPPNPHLTILRRLSVLNDDRLDVLRPASVLGSSFSVTDLSTITARSVLELSSVSRQTVQTHLVHVFAKLVISSRAQLAGEAARREERTP
jgi:predicted ATPase